MRWCGPRLVRSRSVGSFAARCACGLPRRRACPPCALSGRGRSRRRPARAGSFARSQGAWPVRGARGPGPRSEEHTSELQSRENLVCRLLLEKKKKTKVQQDKKRKHKEMHG